jgi:hypothetical protein
MPAKQARPATRGRPPCGLFCYSLLGVASSLSGHASGRILSEKEPGDRLPARAHLRVRGSENPLLFSLVTRGADGVFGSDAVSGEAALYDLDGGDDVSILQRSPGLPGPKSPRPQMRLPRAWNARNSC